MLYKEHFNAYHDLSPWVSYEDKIPYDPIKDNRLYFVNLRFPSGSIVNNMIVYGNDLRIYIDDSNFMVFNYQYKSKGRLTQEIPRRNSNERN